MSTIWLIAQRELKAYLRSPLGYVVAAGVLPVDGIWFIAKALGEVGAKRLSAAVLEQFFYGASGVTMFACGLLAMRLIAYEEEHGSMVILRTAPVRDRDVVLGKFLSVLIVITAINAMTVYIPALIFTVGKVSVGHIAVGYAGVLLLGAAVTAIGLFASALSKKQVIAAILTLVLVGTMILLWLVARVADPPINDFLAAMALHHTRQRAFMTGVLQLENVVFYVGVTFFFLLAAIKTLEARRWR